MRITLFLWAFVISWSTFHFIEMVMANNDSAIIFGTIALVGIYLFVCKIVNCIREDNPIQIKLNVKSASSDDKDKDN